MTIQGILLIGFIIGFVMWLNFTLWDIWKNKSIKPQSFGMFFQMAHKLKNPLKDQYSDFEELSRRVSQLNTNNEQADKDSQSL